MGIGRSSPKRNVIFQHFYVQGLLLMEEISCSPAEVDNLSQYVHGFIHPRWLAGFLPQQYLSLREGKTLGAHMIVAPRKL